MATVINTRNSRYLLSDGEISAESGTTILDTIPGSSVYSTSWTTVTHATLVYTREPCVGMSFRAIVGGCPITTSPVVSIEVY